MGRKRKNNTVRAYKSILQKDKDWDYGFLLNLEKKKLQRMYAYFSTSEIAYGDELVARDLRICRELLRRIHLLQEVLENTGRLTLGEGYVEITKLLLDFLTLRHEDVIRA